MSALEDLCELWIRCLRIRISLPTSND